MAGPIHRWLEVILQPPPFQIFVSYCQTIKAVKLISLPATQAVLLSDVGRCERDRLKPSVL